MNFDLNIGNYNRDELIEMFDLPIHFDNNIVEIKEARLRESIMNNKDINKDTQIKTINFLIEAKNIILNSDNKNQNQPASAATSTTQNNKLISSIYNTDFSLQNSGLDNKAKNHALQVVKETPYIHSFPNDTFPGALNPLQRNTAIKNLNIDSRFRDNYYATSSTNFTVNLPLQISDVAAISLNSIEIPTTFYCISKQYGNNFFTLVVNGNAGIVNIPDGNYSQNTIMQMINTQVANLFTIDPDFANVVFSINLTYYTNNSYTGSGQTMVGFNGNQSANATIELNFQADSFGNYDSSTPLPLKFGWILGFRNGVYVDNLNYVSEGWVDTSGPKYLFLVLDDFNNNVSDGFFGLFNSSLLNKNILARIALQQVNQLNPFNLTTQNNLAAVTTPRQYYGPVNIGSLNVQLLDEYGRIINLNNMDFSFCLSLTIVYDQK